MSGTEVTLACSPQKYNQLSHVVNISEQLVKKSLKVSLKAVAPPQRDMLINSELHKATEIHRT